VARDVVDHATTIVRDEIKMGRLSARRYAEHLRRDVAPRAGWIAAAVALGGLAVLAFAIGLFLGIAHAIGSVAWTFVIYGAALTVTAVIAAALSSQPSRRDEGEAIARRFPAARARPSLPEHGVTAQRSGPEAHREAVEEARRESVVERTVTDRSVTERTLPYRPTEANGEAQRSR
jgi:hypothetical protein